MQDSPSATQKWVPESGVQVLGGAGAEIPGGRALRQALLERLGAGFARNGFESGDARLARDEQWVIAPGPHAAGTLSAGGSIRSARDEN
jgi:hypothetical protein